MYKTLLTSILAFFVCFGNTKAQNLSSASAEDKSTQFTMYVTPRHLPQNAVYYQPDGIAVPLDSYKGKVIVLNFFKATCRKCLIEMPSLNELKDKHPDIVLLAVSEGDENADILDRILHHERQLFNIAVSLDRNQELFFALGGEKVPQTRLIDKKGMLRGTIKGEADFRSEKISQQIDTLVNE